MKFTADFTSIKLNLAAYNRALLIDLRRLNKKAGGEWIHAAVNKSPIPTWSGASRATFQRLASELGTSVPIGPIRAKKSRVSLGQATSAGSKVVEEMVGSAPAFVGFIYTTSLRYLGYNEYNRAVKGAPPQPFSNNVRFTPYGFQDRARQAWQVVADTAKLPDPYRYLERKKI